MILRELIAKLQALPEEIKDLPVILEPNIDNWDCNDRCCEVPVNAFDGNEEPITLYTAMVQCSYTEAEPEKKEYAFDEWDSITRNAGWTVDEKKVVVISSPDLKYGAEEDKIN